jgi:NAD(P)-dependent dehydrogenase (short-subunit alcohol dehydrogenase family)
MDLQLTGKRALVTGASAGTGTSIALTLAAEGARVLVHGRDPDRTEDVTNRIVAAGGQATAVLGDLSRADGAREVARRALAAYGGIDVLVNNAGAIGSYEQWDDVADTDWAAMYDGVVLVVVRLVRSCGTISSATAGAAS